MTPRQQLRARSPAIFRRCTLSFGDGWFVLVDALCERLQHHADHGGPQVEITHIKEKWGELSIDWIGGGLYVDGLVDMTEAMSTHICEKCGKPGTLFEGTVFRTRCPECEALSADDAGVIEGVSGA